MFHSIANERLFKAFSPHRSQIVDTGIKKELDFTLWYRVYDYTVPSWYLCATL